MNFIEITFNFVSFFPGVLWLGLMLFPRRKIVHTAIDIFIVISCILYLANIAPQIGKVLPIIMEPTIAKLLILFQTPEAMLGAWIHFIIGDLWIGRWISDKALAMELSSLIRIPCIVLTVFFGPLGLLGFLIVKGIQQKSLQINN